MTAYRTLLRPAVATTEVSRSRFRCRVERVGSEEAARAVVDAARREHPDAGHHCSAVVLGPPPGLVERSSDDGEPAGTAGAPMLEVLRGAGDGDGGPLADVVAVVTRWFGGTLLGAGGLVRAYGDAVRAALDDAVLVRRALLRTVRAEVDHAVAARLETDLRGRHDLGAVVLGQEYAARATLLLGVPPDRADALRALLGALSGGDAAVEDAGEQWVDRE